jgi:ABC-type molybdate transport system substrate-binding protein
LEVTSATLLDRMLEASVKLGTSTPKSDPSGDYAWEVFRKANAVKPGAYAALDKKAIQLVGRPDAPTAPSGRTVYGMLVGQGAADVFLTYCTNAQAAHNEYPDQRVVALPDALAVGADYGLTVMSDAAPGAYRFAMFILSVEGQRILSKYGFSAPNLPGEGERP